MVNLCPKCGAVNFDEDRQCYRCGAAISGSIVHRESLRPGELRGSAQRGFLAVLIPFYGIGRAVNYYQLAEIERNPSSAAEYRRMAKTCLYISLGMTAMGVILGAILLFSLYSW